MICALVAQGKRVGVMASSHKVITNLLVAVSKESAKHGTNVRIAQKSSTDDDAHAPAGIVQLDDNPEARLALDNREADVLGGTAFMWARPDFVNAVDVLFVDEAGQTSLANAIAVSAAAQQHGHARRSPTARSTAEGHAPRRRRALRAAAHAWVARNDAARSRHLPRRDLAPLARDLRLHLRSVLRIAPPPARGAGESEASRRRWNGGQWPLVRRRRARRSHELLGRRSRGGRGSRRETHRPRLALDQQSERRSAAHHSPTFSSSRRSTRR